MAPHDTARLLAWLRDRGASDALIRVVVVADAEDTLGREDRGLWLQGRLFLATEPRVELRALDDAQALGRTLGLDDDGWDELVRGCLGITAVRLRAHGLLRLPLHAGPAEIKEAHRAIVKRLHPDRLARASEEEREAAGRLVGRVNHARAVLLSRDEVELGGDDDVDLDEPEDDLHLDPAWLQADEVPTEVDLTDVLELLRD